MKYQLLIASLLLSSLQTAFAQNTLDRAGLPGTALASCAYSTRLLSNSYSGNAIRVRRSSDNAEQDIGFTINGDLDTTALKSFTGAGDAFIITWYDQSGNSQHLSQPTAMYQPVIVISSVVQRENNKPFIRFFGVIATSNFKSLVLPAQMTTVGHVSAVHRFEATGDGFILGHTGVYYWHSSGPAGLFSSLYTSNSIQTGTGWVNGVSTAPLSMPWPATLTINELAPASPSVQTNWNNIGTDRITAHNTTGGGGYSELIVFPAVLPAANRGSLEVNQGVYFNISGLLPVSWLSFTGTKQDKAILLEWSTASEQNTAHFIIERSTNGNDWVKINMVHAAGNSNETRRYEFTDTDPVTGNNFYRIYQEDIDHRGSYSDVIVVRYNTVHPGFTIIANPVINRSLQLQVYSPALLFIYSADGRLLEKKQFNKGMHFLDMNGFARGIYFIRESGGRTERIIVQ